MRAGVLLAVTVGLWMPSVASASVRASGCTTYGEAERDWRPPTDRTRPTEVAGDLVECRIERRRGYWMWIECRSGIVVSCDSAYNVLRHLRWVGCRASFTYTPPSGWTPGEDVRGGQLRTRTTRCHRGRERPWKPGELS